MAKRRMGIILFLLCFCLTVLPCYGQAASTADAIEPILPEQECTLTLCYGYDGMVFSNIPVKLYMIAEVSADFQYTPADAFVNAELELNAIQSSAEWNMIRTTLEAYILANGIDADREAATDQLGQVQFASLKPGLYLAIAEPVSYENMRCFFEPALISLPGLGEDGRWQYQVTVASKADAEVQPDPEKEITFKVFKLWKGDSGRNTRPESVQVEIFKDGIPYGQVTLSKENRWCHSWTVKDDGAVWIVVERNIPQGYAVTIEKRGTTFILTNWLIPDLPDKPTPDEPDVPDPSEPDVPDHSEPEVPDPSEPDVPDPSEPDVPDPSEPDVPDPSEPDVPDPSEPDVPDPSEPDVPDPSEPDVPDPSEPDVPDSTEPDTPAPDEPPKTGDTSHILLYVLLMLLSGMLLMILGITGKRKRL